MDTNGYLRNKVASVAVGRCVVTELRCSFAALFAQDCVLPGRNAASLQCRPVATLIRLCATLRSHGNGTAATMPRCHAAQVMRIGHAAQAPHRPRIGSAVNATATAPPPCSHDATPIGSHGHEASRAALPPRSRPPAPAAPRPPHTPPYAPMDPGHCRAHTGGFPLRVTN